MSESDASIELDNVPLIQLLNVEPGGLEIQTVQVIEVPSNNMEFEDESATEESCGPPSVNSEVVYSEEVAGDDSKSEDSDEIDVSDTDEIPIDIPKTPKQEMGGQTKSESWPTLQILPGGVIKHGDKEQFPMSIYERPQEEKDLMYACAKCPMRFQQLIDLTKHIRWHEDVRKREEGLDLSRLSSLEKEWICLKRSRSELEKKYKGQNIKVMSRIVAALSAIDGQSVFDDL